MLPALLATLVVHAVLGLGLWFMSQGHELDNNQTIQVSMVTPEMLAAMQAAAQASNQDAALGETLSLTNQPKKGSADGSPNFTADTTSQNNTTAPAEPILAPSEQLTGEANPENNEQIDTWAEQQQKVVEQMNREERQLEAERTAIKRKEAQALKAEEAKKREKLRQEQRERDAELKALKEAERNQDKQREETRRQMENAKKEAEARRLAEKRKNEEQTRSQSLEASGKALGVDSAMDDEFGSVGTSLENSKARAANDKAVRDSYYDKIAAKIKRNWTKDTSLRISIPVNIRLSDSGSVISVSIKRSSGDKTLDASLKDAIMKSSPLPVPKDATIRQKHFRNLSLSFETY